jgi:hypothetical protein
LLIEFRGAEETCSRRAINRRALWKPLAAEKKTRAYLYSFLTTRKIAGNIGRSIPKRQRTQKKSVNRGCD